MTAIELSSLLRYDEVSGQLFWLRHREKARIGSRAGSPDKDGYLRVKINGRYQFCHRIAWLLKHGHWPADCIDHYDGDRKNNRIGNLRLATNAQNRQNYRAAKRENVSGLLGVEAHKRTGRFRARIQVDGKQVHIGMFATAAEAHLAYVEKKRAMHQFCTI